MSQDSSAGTDVPITSTATLPGTATDEASEKAAAAAAPSAPAQEDEQFSVDSERALCAAVMRSSLAAAEPALVSQLFGLLSPDDFFVEQHQAIWTIAHAMHAAGLDISALAIADASARQDIHVGGAAYLSGMLEDPLCRVTSPQALVSAAERIKGLALLRRLQASLRQALALCRNNDFPAVASFIEDDLSNLRRSATTSRSGPKPLSNFLQIVLGRIEAMSTGQATIESVPTGHEHLDECLGGGLAPESLTVLAARPAMGKTAKALNIARNIARANGPVLIFSLEMTGSALTTRAIAAEGRISMQRLRTGALLEDEWSRLVDSAESLKDTPIYIDESPGLTLSHIRSRARAFVQAHPGGVIMLDYLQIVAMEPWQKDKLSHVADVSRGLKEMARELQVPVVALAQLNRELERRANKRPMMSDLRESGQIEQDAEVIIFLYRDEVYNPDTPDRGISETIIAKNRDGATATVRETFHGELMLFTEVGIQQGE